METNTRILFYFFNLSRKLFSSPFIADIKDFPNGVHLRLL